MDLDKIFLPCEGIDARVITSKRQALTAIAAMAATHRGLDQRMVFEVLNEREHLGSTAIGNGVAMPHGKVKGLDSLVGCLIRLPSPIDFDAPDGKPVDLIAALLAPETGGGEHLRVLARLSRMLRDPRQCAALRACSDGESLRRILTAEPQRSAA